MTDFELLRNYLLKNTSTEEKKDVIESLDEIENLLGTNTELFLKHYVMHKYGIKSIKADLPYKILVKQEKANNTIKFLVDLMQKALYYNRIITYENCNEFEKKVFPFFKPRRQQQFRSIVLSLMHQRDLKSINKKRYEDALRFLYEFFIYFNVIGEQTSNKIEDVV